MYFGMFYIFFTCKNEGVFLTHQCFQSLNHLLAIPGEDNEAINMAIDCVGQAGETKLIEELVRFLMGDKDGIPKVSLLMETPLHCCC